MKIVLVGNPNAGKSTFFNNLTGLKQHVGNWPGKTVEKKEARINYKGRSIDIIDLPGTYSLSAYSLEEIIVKDYLKNEEYDLIVNIIDANNFERNLYLTTELMDIGKKFIVVLNMNQIAEKKGIHIDEKKLEKELGVPVIKLEAIDKELKDKFLSYILNLKLEKPKKINIENKEQIVIERYRFIEDLAKRIMKKEHGRKSLTDQIDRFLLNKVFGPIFFLFVMFILFNGSFAVSDPFSNAFEIVFEAISEVANKILRDIDAPIWFSSFISDAIIGGIGQFIVFIPIIFSLFLFMGFLEDSGYMARAAVIADRTMKRIGLNGRAFVPMLLGFGCSVPAILATRTMKEEKDRLAVLLAIPFISCSARLPVYILFTSLFFEPNIQGVVVFSLYLLGIIISLLVIFLMKKFVFKTKTAPLIIELPSYRFPDLKSMVVYSWKKTLLFVWKAGYLIFISAIFIWFLANLPPGVEYGSDNSLIGVLGHVLSPVFSPLGFDDWRASVALTLGISAKEVVVGTITSLYGSGENMKHFFTPLTAYSFMVFTLLYVPCVATLGAIKKETGSWKWVLFSTILSTSIAWFVAFVVYNLGMALGFGG